MQSIRHLLAGKNILAVESGETTLGAAQYMIEHVIGAVPVLERGKIVGIFTERDFMKHVVVGGRDAARLPVTEVMTREVVTAEPTDSYPHCIAKMRDGHFRHLPVVENGELLGTISLRDLLDEDLKEMEEEVRLMTEYLQYVPPGRE